jgi:hypothetical protein
MRFSWKKRSMRCRPIPSPNLGEQVDGADAQAQGRNRPRRYPGEHGRGLHADTLQLSGRRKIAPAGQGDARPVLQHLVVLARQDQSRVG